MVRENFNIGLIVQYIINFNFNFNEVSSLRSAQVLLLERDLHNLLELYSLPLTTETRLVVSSRTQELASQDMLDRLARYLRDFIAC